MNCFCISYSIDINGWQELVLAIYAYRVNALLYKYTFLLQRIQPFASFTKFPYSFKTVGVFNHLKLFIIFFLPVGSLKFILVCRRVPAILLLLMPKTISTGERFGEYGGSEWISKFKNVAALFDCWDKWIDALSTTNFIGVWFCGIQYFT